MRLISFTSKASKADEKEASSSPSLHVGVHVPDKDVVVDLTVAFNDPLLTMRRFLDGGDASLQRAAKAVAEATTFIPMADINLMAPIYDPEKVLCVGMNYVDHCEEQGQAVPTEPLIFSKFASAINEPFGDIVLDETEQLDYEVELVIVIGKAGRKIKAADAMNHVVGFMVAHDVSARDWQLKRNGGQWLIGKTMDTYAPIGPAIVTKDEVGDPHKLDIKCYLNDKEVQNSNTKNLVFNTNQVVEWVSRFITLKPGDIILTGTPPGVGAFRKPQLWLKAGDVVKCEIQNIGSITNKIVAPK